MHRLSTQNGWKTIAHAVHGQRSQNRNVRKQFSISKFCVCLKNVLWKINCAIKEAFKRVLVRWITTKRSEWREKVHKVRKNSENFCENSQNWDCFDRRYCVIFLYTHTHARSYSHIHSTHIRTNSTYRDGRSCEFYDDSFRTQRSRRGRMFIRT